MGPRKLLRAPPSCRERGLGISRSGDLHEKIVSPQRVVEWQREKKI